MNCDLGILLLAIEAAVEAESQRNEFYASIHGVPLERKAEPAALPTTAEELAENTRNALFALGPIRVEAA